MPMEMAPAIAPLIGLLLPAMLSAAEPEPLSRMVLLSACTSVLAVVLPDVKRLIVAPLIYAVVLRPTFEIEELPAMSMLSWLLDPEAPLIAD